MPLIKFNWLFFVAAKKKYVANILISLAGIVAI
jgi:hypothetical protein